MCRSKGILSNIKNQVVICVSYHRDNSQVDLSTIAMNNVLRLYLLPIILLISPESYFPMSMQG